MTSELERTANRTAETESVVYTLQKPGDTCNIHGSISVHAYVPATEHPLFQAGSSDGLLEDVTET